MTDTWDIAGYVASSRYRQTVCEYLSHRGPGLPSEIASETELAQPHVSRALSELRDRDVVELLVPDSQQKGRLYDLTETGRIALERLTRGRNAVDVEVVGRDAFPYGGVIGYLEDNHRAAAQAVAACDGELATIHFFGEEPADHRSAPIVRLWSVTGVNGQLASGSTGRHEFTVFGLENVTLLELAVDDDLQIGVSLDDRADVPMRSFTEELEAHLEN